MFDHEWMGGGELRGHGHNVMVGGERRAAAHSLAMGTESSSSVIVEGISTRP